MINNLRVCYNKYSCMYSSSLCILACILVLVSNLCLIPHVYSSSSHMSNLLLNNSFATSSMALLHNKMSENNHIKLQEAILIKHHYNMARKCKIIAAQIGREVFKRHEYTWHKNFSNFECFNATPWIFDLSSNSYSDLNLKLCICDKGAHVITGNHFIYIESLDSFINASHKNNLNLAIMFAWHLLQYFKIPIIRTFPLGVLSCLLASSIFLWHKSLSLFLSKSLSLFFYHV